MSDYGIPESLAREDAYYRAHPDAFDGRPETCNKPGHVYGCAGNAGGDHELVTRKPGQPYTGFPTCYVCGMDYEPLTGDGDGQCGPCYNGWTEDEEGYARAPLSYENREGLPEFNGAFDRW